MCRKIADVSQVVAEEDGDNPFVENLPEQLASQMAASARASLGIAAGESMSLAMLGAEPSLDALLGSSNGPAASGPAPSRMPGLPAPVTPVDAGVAASPWGFGAVEMAAPAFPPSASNATTASVGAAENADGQDGGGKRRKGGAKAKAKVGAKAGAENAGGTTTTASAEPKAKAKAKSKKGGAGRPPRDLCALAESLLFCFVATKSSD